MTNTTDLTITEQALRFYARKDGETLAKFRQEITSGASISHALSWGATDIIVAERRQAAAEALLNQAREVGAQGVQDAAEAIRETVEREIGYFDPTSTSSSASAAFVASAQFKAARAVLTLLDEVATCVTMDAAEAAYDNPFDLG
jgi:type VI protein secretion system component VasF